MKLHAGDIITKHLMTARNHTINYNAFKCRLRELNNFTHN